MTEFKPPHDEAAVRSRGLHPFVDAARSQAVAPVTLSAETLHAEWLVRRGRRRGWLAAGGLASAAAALIWTSVGAGPAAVPPQTSSPVVTAPSEAAPAAAVKLAAAVSISPVVDGSPGPVVHAAYVVELRSGGYRIEMSPTEGEVLTVRFGDESLELAQGVVVLLLTGPAPEIRLESGTAMRVAADGTRTALGLAAQPIANPASASSPSASAMARRAERQLEAGDRDEAIQTLRTLVTKFPMSASARSGAIDLARLLRAAGRNDEARCAYGVYLERWPHTQLRGEIEQARERLGAGPQCRGLQPR